jgi:hypothetical protein
MMRQMRDARPPEQCKIVKKKKKNSKMQDQDWVGGDKPPGWTVAEFAVAADNNGATRHSFAIDHEADDDGEFDEVKAALKDAVEDPLNIFVTDDISSRFNGLSFLPSSSSRSKKRHQQPGRRQQRVRTTTPVAVQQRKRNGSSSPSDDVASGSGPSIAPAKSEPVHLYLGESLLDTMPAEILQKILFFLEDATLRIDIEYLDTAVALPEEGRKISRSMLFFLLVCKRIWNACMRRGGIPSARPLFCIITFARRGDRDRLSDMVLMWCHLSVCFFENFLFFI